MKTHAALLLATALAVSRCEAQSPLPAETLPASIPSSFGFLLPTAMSAPQNAFSGVIPAMLSDRETSPAAELSPAAADVIKANGCEMLRPWNWEVQAQAGAYFSSDGVAPHAAPYNFVPMELRLGLITDIGCSEGILRGNFEPMLGISGGAVLLGAGDGYVGSSLTLRYNFVQPGCRLVPYVQIAGGVTYNNGFRDTSQVALTGAVEFVLQGQVGLRWFVTDRLAFNVEAGYIHISDADTSLPNYGVNAFGASIGLSYRFGPAPH